MTILYTSSARVKSPYFGRGLLRSLPNYRASFTQADLDWLREQDQMQRDLDAEVEAMALEAAQQAAYENGWL